MDKNIITLHGQAQSLVWELQEGAAPLWRYWGKRLPDDADIPLRGEAPAPSFSLDKNIGLSLFPCFGHGWYNQSALLAHRGGQDFAQSITSCHVERESESALCFHMEDAVAKLKFLVRVRLCPQSDVLSVTTTLTNLAETPLVVERLANAALMLPHDAAHVRSFTGKHGAEFNTQEEALGRSIWVRENRRGITSHADFPGAYVLMPNAGEHDGGVYGAQLAWSGNSFQALEWLDEGCRQWQLGAWLAPGEVSLDAGGSITTPELLATYSPHGCNGVARNFHAAIRARLNWPSGTMRPRPVLLNTWEGFYFKHEEAKLKSLAAQAAKLGVERFVLDDGWFKGRVDDTRALGDWVVDAEKYPHGLAPLAQHVTQLGMEFGLWVEPEMVNPESDLFRAHPDWALQIAGRPHLTARNQLVLDMTNAAVQDYIFNALDALLRTLPIAYLKWDHNRNLTSAADAQGRPAYYKQVQALYALLARLRTAHPHVEIETCAGGGGRNDAGIFQHTHRAWVSDTIDPRARIEMHKGFLHFFPPEIMGAHIGSVPSHSTGRTQHIDFRAGVALAGHLGLEYDISTLDSQEKTRLKHWIARYKQWRDHIHGSEVWQGAHTDAISWQAYGREGAWLLFIVRQDMQRLRHMPDLRLPFVDEARTYAITQLEPEETEHAPLHGAWLKQQGFPIAQMQAEQVSIYRLQVI